MIIRRGLFTRAIRQRETIQHFISQQQILALGIRSEDRSTGLFNSALQLLSPAFDHQLVQLRDRLCILSNLLLCGRIQDRKTRVYVPLICVYAKGDVDLDVLDAAYPAGNLPGELIVCVPRRTHAEKRGVCHGLCIGCDAVVHLAADMNVFGLEGGKHLFHESHTLIGCAVLNEDLVELLILFSSFKPRYVHTSGWPLGFTFGPCNEWHEIISTSGGRWLSNAASSGDLQDVWPPTIAPTFVAGPMLGFYPE